MLAEPTHLYPVAQEERARRKAATERAGQGRSERAQRDDVIWSNIEQMAALASTKSPAPQAQSVEAERGAG